MPDLGNLTFSASLTVTRCPPTHKSLGDPPDPGTVKAVGVDCNWDQNFRIPCPNRSELRNSGEVRVARQSKVGVKVNHHHHPHHRAKKASNAKSLEDHVRDWVGRKKESGAPESRCFLPFLVGEKKMVGCLVCRSFIYPGEGVFCSVRGCRGVYHSACVKDRLGICNLKKFKCPQHVCFICKQKLNWRCVRCTVASHTKCAPWPDEVIDLKDQSGQAVVCWRHPTDWRLDGKVSSFLH